MKREQSFRDFMIKYLKIALLLYTVFSISYLLFTYIVEKEQEQNKLEFNVESCSNYLENVLNNISSINYALFSDESVSRIIDSPLTIDKYTYVKAMVTLNRHVNNNDIISSLYLYHERAELVLASNEGKYALEDFPDRKFLKSLTLAITPSITSRVLDKRSIITLTIRWPMSSYSIKGYICINIDSTQLIKQFSKLLNDEYSLHIMVNNKTFFTYDPQNIIENPEKNFISKKALSQFNVSISVMREKRSFFLTFLDSYFRESLFFLLLAALLSLVFFLLLNKLSKLFRPMILELAALYREKESQHNYTLNEMKKDFEQLITDRQILFNQMDEMKWLVEEKVLADLFRGAITNGDEFQALCNSFGIINKGYHENCYLIACACVFSKEVAITTEDIVFSKVLIKNIMMSDNQEDLLMYAVVESEENVGMLLNYSSSLSPQEAEALIEEKIAKIEESFSDNPNIDFFVSIINPVDSVEKICKAYNQAKANLIYRYVFLNKNHIIDTLNSNESTVLMPYVDVQMIKSATNADQFDIVHRYIMNLADEYRQNPTSEMFYQLKLRAVMGACIILDQTYLSDNIEVQKRILSNLEKLFQAEDEKDIITALIYLTNDISHHRIFRMPEGESKNGYLQQAFSFIEGHYDKDLSVSDIANHLNLNPKYLARLFKKNTGQTMTQYISELRLKKAVSLLNRTDLSVREISEQIGFNDSRSFIRLFKKTFDMTPGEYKASRR